MATKNQRIAAYVPENVYQKYQSFKVEKGLGDSQALIQILSEYFGVAYEVSYRESLGVLERLAQLEASLSVMRSDLLSELKESVFKELTPQVVRFDAGIIDSPWDEEKTVLSDSPGDSLSKSLESDEVPLLLPESAAFPILSPIAFELPQITLSGAGLAERLKVGPSTVSTRKKDSPEKFAAWTQSKDPDAASWKVNLDGTFSLAGEVPDWVKEALTKPILDGLTNGALAKRLGIDGSTISHWKKDKTSDEFLCMTRDKDPDRIGWVFNQETKRFTPEREIPSDSPRVTQSELPGISGSEDVEF